MSAFGLATTNPVTIHSPTDHSVTKSHHQSRERSGVLSAFAKAVYKIATGRVEPVGTIDEDHPYVVVPLTLVERPDKHLGFHEQTHSFVVQKSGTYLAEFYLQVGPANGRTHPLGQVNIALRKTHESNISLIASTMLVPMFQDLTSAPYSILAFGTHHELLNLSKGDALQLVVTDLPNDVNGMLPWSYFGGTMIPTSEVAYLTLTKID